jgi:nitrogen fixation/metabolism regulation signal transduction histidine kinase
VLQLDSHCPIVYADAHRLRQVFHNLMKNALEATEQLAHPQIIIKTDCQTLADSIRIDIQDNGNGISAQALNWIFEPYATDKPKGSGLGLAIVKKIIEEHNGEISIDEQLDTGARFIIKLPLGSNNLVEPERLSPNTTTE